MASCVNKDSSNYQREKREFLDGLRHFHSSRGTPFERIPRIGGSEVDLYLLYQKVTSLGGWKKVSDNERWDEILKEFSYPKGCLNAEQSLKYIYIRYFNIYEQINFLGEDPKAAERRDDDGPIRKKLCGPQYNVPLSYNAPQHRIAVNLRAGYGLSTKYSKISDYDKLEKALLSGMPNEVDFVINVCTLLSNESKHTLRLDKCTVLTDLLLGHVGVFHEGSGSLEKLYENEWRKQSGRDFIRFWYDVTVDNEEARNLLGCKRTDCKKDMLGKGILSLGRDLGVKDKEGIRITQVAIILRNLSFELNNMKYLANSDLVFRFLVLCTFCNYGTLRQLALDTIGNLAAEFKMDPVDSFKSKTILNLLVQCITANDKFSVVSGLEMVSKLARQEANEFVLSEKLDLYIYEEIAKYLTIQDIQLIVSSLEAMYQLSELGEETNSKIAEVSNSVDTLVSLITVEAQSYGPNSLVGIKVVEYCPPSQVGSKESEPSGVGPPNTGQASKNKSDQQASTKKDLPKPPPSSTAMEITTCNWLQATFEQKMGSVVSHIPVYSDYLQFCKKFQLSEALSSQNFQKTLKVVFPRSKNIVHSEKDGSRQLCIEGINRRDNQLPFSIAGQVSRSTSLAPTTSVRPPNSAIHSPNLIQRLATPPTRQLLPNSNVYPTGQPVQPAGMAVSNPGGTTVRPAGTVTLPTYSVSGGIFSQGTPATVTEAHQPTPLINTAVTTNTPQNQNKSKGGTSKKKSSKKNAPILPRPEKNVGNLPNIVPKITQGQQPQTQLVQNIQYATYPQEIVYQSVDTQNSEAKYMVKTLLAQKIRQGNVIIQQPIQGVMNMDFGGGGDGQTVQYQTSFPQNVQQTTYIQYTTPGSSTQTVQAIFQPPSSQLQTIVVQPGDMIMQSPMQSNLGTQMVTHQQLVVNPQQQIITQQPFMAPQQITQNAIIQQSQIVPQTQVIANTGQFQVAQQASSHVSSAEALSNSQFVSTAHSVNQGMIHCSDAAVTSASQNNIHSSGQIKELTQNVASNSEKTTCTNSNTNSSSDRDNKIEGVQMYNKTSVEPSINLTTVGNEINETVNGNGSKMDVSFEEAEIECAVGSIMEDASESMEAEEEPVMIENDGNELMFEQKYQPMKIDEELYNNEAAAAVGGLENEREADKCDVDTNNTAMKQNNGILEQTVNMQNGYCGDDDDLEEMDEKKKPNLDDSEDIEEIVLEGVNKSDNKKGSDAEIIAKFRAETPIVVPLISENGVFEQDFEARMAVENLLKDVEFHVTGDDTSSEENVKLMYSQQENPGSVQTLSSLGDTEHICEDSRDSVTSESLNSTKTTTITQNGVSSSLVSSSTPVSSSISSSVPPSSLTAKSLQNSNHLTHNGIVSENKPLVNGNVSSPEHSVPSPSGLDNVEATKLVNGLLSDDTIKGDLSKPLLDKLTKMNGVVNHTKTVSKVQEVAFDETGQVSDLCVKLGNDISNVETKTDKTQDILAQSIMDTGINKSPEDSLDQTLGELKSDKANTSDILAQSILENDIQPSDCDIPDTTPASVTAVVKQIIPNSVYGNYMTVQINNNTIPITFTNNTLVTSSKASSNQINVCNSRHIPTPDTSRDNELSCDSTTSSIATSDLSIVVSEKHSSSGSSSQIKLGLKDGNKSQTSPRAGEPKKSKAKKRSRSKSGGSGSSDSRPSSVTSPATSSASVPEYMCEWSQCRQCFDNAKSVFCHVCSVHLKTEYDGLCKWEGCESLVRKRWSLFTHIQDHHCSDTSLRLAAQRRLQAFQTGQHIQAPTIPAMVYPDDAATQAIRRFLPKTPYPEFLEGREGPVTKHIRLTSALILRNLAKYSPAGRSLLKKHERVISYTCMSAVESSTALASCLYEILQDQH